MKYFVKISVILMMCLPVLFSACKKDDNDDNDGGFPITSTASWEELDYRLLLAYDGYYDEGVISVYSFEEVESSKLKLNGDLIDLDWSAGDEGYDGYAFGYFDEGDEISYELTINNKKFSGVLTIACELTADFPDFNETKDFTFSWTIEKSPQIYLCIFNISNYNDYDVNFFNIDGSKRQYTISKSNYLPDWSAAEVDLTAFNFNSQNNDKFFAFSISDDYAYYEREKYSNSNGDIIKNRNAKYRLLHKILQEK